MMFRRHGDDLLIDLDMNGSYNRGQGTIRTRRMAFTGFQVETLDLRNFSSDFANMSLVSIWEGTTNEKQRFKLTRQSDAYRHVALPA